MATALMLSIEDVLVHTRVHDVDSHVVEPADLWLSRMSPKWGDAIPHVAVDPETGSDYWFVDGRRAGRADIGAAGVGNDVPYDPDTAAGGWDPHARLAWMDRHGVYSQVLYPNLLGFYSTAFVAAEPAFGVECCRAYNDFQTEFASADPERLIPISNVPFWNIDAAVDEIVRCHGMGHRGINLGWEPEKLGLPRLREPHWEPLLKAVEDLDIPVSFHIGFNTEKVPTDVLAQMSRLDKVGWVANFFLGNAYCVSELIVSRICDRYPRLKFVSVESGSGFLPFVVDALDWQFDATLAHRENPRMLLPSEYFRRQIYGTFWFEPNVVAAAERYPDNFMFESDYPHPTSLTPTDALPAVKGPHDTILANFEGVAPDVVVKLLHDNAAKVYGLP